MSTIISIYFYTKRFFFNAEHGNEEPKKLRPQEEILKVILYNIQGEFLKPSQVSLSNIVLKLKNVFFSIFKGSLSMSLCNLKIILLSFYLRLNFSTIEFINVTLSHYL